ncbi:POTRA domain-containing protein [Peredibacter sp. HCB2-198]|uniref:POTRA domain-containing protein n=1 Tax=Peredibacter sp. HCB2-198 TaxID=3383025 RepID=UPI0038B68E90
MKFLITLFLILLPAISFAEGLTLSKVNVECLKSDFCTERKNRFATMVGDYRSLVHMKDTLRVLASDGGYQSFTYELDQTNGLYTLNLRFQLKPLVEEINIGFTDRNLEYDPAQLISMREGDYFEIQKLKENMDGLQKRLENMGYPKNSHTYEVKERGNKVSLSIVITLGEPRIFKSIRSNSKSSYVQDYLVKKFYNLYNKPFEMTKFKLYLDDAQKELFKYGYFLISMDFVPEIKGNRVTLDIKVTNDQLFAFDFKNLKQEHRDVVHNLLLDLFRKYKRPLSDSTIKSALKEHYLNRARLNADIRIENSEYLNMYNETVHLYRVFLDEKYKTRLTAVTFTGNNYFSNKRLQKMFDKEAFELASIKFYDPEFFEYFMDYLRGQYIQRGFVQVRVLRPVSNFDAQKHNATVDYIIQENQRAFVRKVEFEGIPLEYEDKLLTIMQNKVTKPFNPIKMVEDIKKVASTLQEEGYYYAEVLNANDEDLVRYSKTGADVDIRFKINLGPMVKLNRILFLGNNKTRKKVLLKKIPLEPGDTITPSRTRDIESALSATGLFNTVNVTPLRHNSKNAQTDLLIRVVEREYGLVEIAPGYRTDLGLKLTGTLSYQNIAGENKSITLRTQLNQRLSYQTLDPQRRKDAVPILEHNTSLTYTQGDIFDTLIDFSASGAYQLKRFYSFDAEILRANTIFTRDLTKRLSSSLRYQYEDIQQYNATNEIDNGSFEIGAITPSLTYDLRNSQINPVKGAFFNLSTEWANPYFLSQKEPDLTINYYKLISRNRFYIPFKNGTVAISMVGGIQENLAREKVTVNGVTQTEGYIPNIKVFRLTGMDIIRGFSDEEANRLPNGNDISEEKIDNRAYLANFKFEPRYFINDALMAGVFYDAGRVFVNRVDLGDLRDSVGVTFKIITPVGTLDFDYGIKLLRERNKDGSLEDPGRFHVSIGFF